MRALLIASSSPHAGKTGIAAALTQRFAYDGKRVLALRLGATSDPSAVSDAAFYKTLPGARGRGGSPIAPSVARTTIADLAGDSIPIVEASDVAEVPALARDLSAATVIVLRGVPSDDDIIAAQDFALALADLFLGVVVTAVPAGLIAAVQAAVEDAALPVLAVLPEDKLLYSPTIGEIADTLQADLLLGEDSEEQVIEQLMIGPVSSDPGQPYYARRGNKAVITRSDKTDLQLAALQTDTDCLILTGGLTPSPYTLDRASNEEVALMVTRGDTGATVNTLAGIFERSRFSSERKLERMSEMLRGTLDYEAVVAALQ
jgi:BioD-like phosphotransacetylase family protein